MNYRYLTCYRRIGDEFTIYFNDKSKLHARLSACRNHLHIYGLSNGYLFDIFNIDKFKLIRKLNYKYRAGNWPESNEQGTVALLNALIKETKIRYYAVPRFKYTKKYVSEKVNNNKLLHIFLKKKRIYNKFVDSCLNANTIEYFIDRQDFNQAPFMAFSWANSHILNNHDINWGPISVEFERYKRHMYEEI